MEIEKYNVTIGVGANKKEALIDAIRNDPILAEEVLNLAINLGYKFNLPDEDDDIPAQSAVSNFESF